MLTVVFGESTMSRIQVQLRCNRFKEDRKDANDDARHGRPSTISTDENIEAVNKVIKQAIFTDILGMERATAKIPPKLLNFKQKQRRMDISQEMLTTIQIC